MTFSSSSQSDLIFQLDFHLRRVVEKPNRIDLEQFFHFLRQCHIERLNEEHRLNDDQLYIPSILLLRQFPKFTEPQLFDELLNEFLRLFDLIPICSKKILDDFLCLIGLMLSKKIVESHDEIQQKLFLKFFRSFLNATKINSKFFFDEFLGDFNRNLTIIGHFSSSLLQIFERVTSLDVRLEILECFSTIFSTKNVEEQKIVGQILSSFLPGFLKTLAQNLGPVHHRLVEKSLFFLTFVLRVTVEKTSKPNGNFRPELRDLFVERDENWLKIVDSHLVPILERFSNDYLHHENVRVRRALAVFMFNILSLKSTSFLRFSSRTALKIVLIILAKKNLDETEIFIENLLRGSTNVEIPDFNDEFLVEFSRSNDLKISVELFRQSQNDLFVLLNDENENSTNFLDRRSRLEFFIGFYRLISHEIDDLFQMESFSMKIFKFLVKNLDFVVFTQSHLHLLNHRSSNRFDTLKFDSIEFESIYKHFRPDVEEQIDVLFKFYLRSNENFIDFLFEQIDRRTIVSETNQKIFYLISRIFSTRKFDRDDDFRLLTTIFHDLTSNKKKRNETIATRNLTIFFLLQTFRTFVRPDHLEYLIEYVPLLLLCHSSRFTIVHRSSLFSLTNFNENLPKFLVEHAENIVDRSIRKLHTSNYDGYFILIEFVRLGQNFVVNLPILTHVIEELLLELSSLPSTESIRLTFEFLQVFCQQVVDIVDKKKKRRVENVSSTSFAEFVLNLQNEFHPTVENEDDEEETNKEKHPWHQMLVSIVDVFQHFISSPDVHVRSNVLDAFPSLGRVLSTIDENLFLPLVHKIWPGLVQRFHDQDFNVRIRCLTTIECLCQLCSDFIDRRIQQDFLPLFLQQLERFRTISSTHSLEFRYVKNFLTKIASILNVLTIQFDQIEDIILNLFLYLQNEHLAPIAFEQLKLFSRKYADEIWLKMILHDENEDLQRYFPQMKVYKAQPRLTLESKWKSTLIDCLNRC